MDIKTRKLLKVGLLANAFEWYEFSIFGFLASIIGVIFFKADQPILQVIQAFSVFSLSYVARPIGSIFFGMLGNKIGQPRAMRISLILMAIPTILIGLLPAYDQIGSIATALLVMLRLVQGFAAGGELPVSICYVLDLASGHASHKSILCSSIAIGQTIGILCGSLITSLLVTSCSQATLLDWGWRIPFLLGIPMSLVIAYIRQASQQPHPVSHKHAFSISQQWSQLQKPLLKAVCLLSFLILSYYIIAIWMPVYLHTFLGVAPQIAYPINTFVLAMILPFYLTMGYFSQRFGYRRVIVTNTLIMLSIVFPVFIGLQLRPSFSLLCGLQLLFAFFASTTGLFVEVLGELFPAHTRSLGVSLACTLPSTFIGGTAPLVCSYMIHKTGWLLFPAFYILFFGLLALPVALQLKTSSR
jgi:MFS transporter, MHS family, proline/betaine transporter